MDRGKARAGGRGRYDRNKVTISKHKEAELMAEYNPWKAKIDLTEQTLRERERPAREEHPK